MELAEYKRIKGLSWKQLGAQIGYTGSHVGQVAGGHKRPSRQFRHWAAKLWPEVDLPKPPEEGE